MKKYMFPIIYTLSIILIGSLLSSILYYFNITGDKVNKILLYFISIIAIFIGSIKLGKHSNKKGIISGLIYFIIWFIFMMILSLFIFKTSFKPTTIFYYIFLLAFSLLGGIIGKNNKEEANID